MLQLLFASVGLRQMLGNWELVARETLHRARRDALWARDAQLETTVRELGAMLPSVSDAPNRGSTAVLPVDMLDQGVTLRFFSTMTTLGAPQDVTLQELRIEAFHPVDAGTESRVREAFETQLLCSKAAPFAL